MRKFKLLFLLVASFSISIIGNNVSAQGRGVVKGKVSDAQSRQPLIFANVGIEGTSFGTTADEEGKFSITLPAGSYRLAISYLSYNTVFKNVDVDRDEILDVGNIELEVMSLMGEEAVVTAIARGQLAAINQQVNSNTIVNVVSRERIQELPDQNAAETVGRLPGVSLIRDGGEGTMVTLRGMAPRLNLITINGERVPSTNDQDRSVDLSMFSTEALAGIEVFKALRPDMDADALGGTVNFTARKASEGFHGDVKVQTGYNSLKKEPGQYQGSATFENRFFNNKLGAIVSGTAQKANRSYEGYTGSWDDIGSVDAEGNKTFVVSSFTLSDQYESRYRYNGSVNMDYQFKRGELMFSTNYGRSDRDETRWRRNYSASSSYQNYDVRKRESTNNVLTSSLGGQFKLLNLFDLDFSAGYSSSSNQRPLVERFQFRELGAFNANDETSYDVVVAAAQNDLEETWLKVAYKDYYDVMDINKSIQANLKMPFRLGSHLDGYIKIGGKFRTMNRDYDVTREWTRSFIGKYIIEDTLQHPDWVINEDNGWILMENFIGDYNTEDFMRHFDKPYYMGPGADQVNGPGLDYEKLREFRDEYYEDYWYVDPTIDIADYRAGEKIEAAYAMYEFNIYNRLTLLGGIRYEYTKNNYNSIFGTPQVDEEGEIINISGLRDTVGTREHQQFLPQFQLKYQPFKWVDIRLAGTKSLGRPNFFSLVPWERVNHFDHTVERGNPDLEHMSAWNYDAIVSFYGKFGLFTLGGFYKSLENIDYTLTTRLVDKTLPTTNGYDLTMPVNAERTSTIKGFEIDLQTNFRFLPSPFDGFLINANYTMIQSETFFPYIIITNLPVFPYTATVTDTMRSGPMPGQVDDVINLSIGYEKRGFSARLSMVYQSSSLQISEDSEIGGLAKSVGKNESLDNYTGSSTRWDMTVKQKFKKNYTLYANLNNITNTPETSYLAGSKNNLITRNIVYGFTFDIGLRYKF
ncbi:MAG: TonB-dependent receptor [Bacteroidales bacterium]|nr:TonB-dependent receptor [Bacteroidales bacterium]MCF8391841.1 TonB-dependent receptor [Bacteroidales bacterium]